MEEIELASWGDFEREVATLREQYPEHRALTFRGVSDAAWPLTTTLERYIGVDVPFEDYYRHASASEPQVRSFTEALWEPIESYPAIRELASDYDKLDLHLWGGRLQALGYLAYLRHFGFPSPLLDWTRSPAIAAFFAFRDPVPPTAARVAIYAYCERPTGSKMWDSGRPRVFRIGPNVRTARRHHLQQGEYTMCLQWDGEVGWRFVQHERVFVDGPADQDALWKFTLPWSERVRVMQLLDDYNVNAFSLFESNEALLETVALRRLLLEPAKGQRLSRPSTAAAVMCKADHDRLNRQMDETFARNLLQKKAEPPEKGFEATVPATLSLPAESRRPTSNGRGAGDRVKNGARTDRPEDGRDVRPESGEGQGQAGEAEPVAPDEQGPLMTRDPHSPPPWKATTRPASSSTRSTPAPKTVVAQLDREWTEEFKANVKKAKKR